MHGHKSESAHADPASPGDHPTLSMAKERANSPSPAKTSQVSGLNFLRDCIRLGIYSEILVHSEPIDFVADDRSSPPSLLIPKTAFVFLFRNPSLRSQLSTGVHFYRYTNQY
jgi:hypothetical protein